MYLADRFSDALKQGGRALFVGIGSEQLPPEYREHPRVVCWDSDAPELHSKSFTELPARVRVVVMSRFASHAAIHRIAKAAKRSDALFMGKLSGTGEMARMLREGLPVPAPPPVITTTDVSTATAAADPPPTPPPPDQPFASMSDVIRHYAAAELHTPILPGRKRATPIPFAFYERLTETIRSHGFTDATHENVSALFSNLRSKIHRASPPPPAPPPVVAPEEPLWKLEPVTAPVVPAEPLPPDLDLLVQMAADLELHGMQSVELADQLRRLAAEQRGLRDYKTKYDQLRSLFNGNGATL